MALCLNTTVNTTIEVTHTTLFRDNLPVILPRPATEVTIGMLVDNAKGQMDQTLFSNLVLVSPSPSKEKNLVSQHTESYGQPHLRFTSTPPPTSDPVQKMLEAFKGELQTALQKEREAVKLEREAEKLESEAERKAERTRTDATLQVLQARITTIEQTLELPQHGISMRSFIDAIERLGGAQRGSRAAWYSQNAGRLALLAGMPEADLTHAFHTMRTDGDGFAHIVDSNCLADAIAAMDPADGKAGFEKFFMHHLGHAIEDEIEGRVAPTKIIGGFPPQHGPPLGPPFTPTPAPGPAPSLSQAI